MKHSLFIILIISILSCNQFKRENAPIKPNPSGKSGEIVVVIDDKYWDSRIGDTILFKLSEPFGVLPQDEPFFNVVHIPYSSFQSIFKTHRNLVFIDIDSKYTTPEVKVKRDKWANYQLIYTFFAPNDSAFLELWRDNVDKMMSAFFEEEMSRYQKSFANDLNKKAMQEIADMYHISMQIPTGFYLDVKKEHFAWISRETEISSQGIFIYDYSYTDTNTFTQKYLIAKRDLITKENVPGPNEGTYMQTEKRVPIESQAINLNGQYALLLRGLWYTENYFLGGPFVSITTLDEKRNRIITVEAYVYAGKQDKKLYLWQTEAIIRTLKIL